MLTPEPLHCVDSPLVASCINLTVRLNIARPEEEPEMRLKYGWVVVAASALMLRGHRHGILAGGLSLAMSGTTGRRAPASGRHDHRLSDDERRRLRMGRAHRPLRPDDCRAVGWAPARAGPRAGKRRPRSALGSARCDRPHLPALPVEVCRCATSLTAGRQGRTGGGACKPAGNETLDPRQPPFAG